MRISECTKCTRIQLNLKKIKQQYPTYHCKPVEGCGNLNSRICLIGLAPGLHGANKTGIPFTDDFSGAFVRNILYEINLHNIFITNVVRCYPERNMPKAEEKNNCQSFNTQELSKLTNLKVIITLGEIAYKQIMKLYKISLEENKFKHDNIIQLGNNIFLLSSFHCSKLNVNTHKLSKNMLKGIFLKAIKLINDE